MNDITWHELGQKWNKALIKVLMLIPGAILGSEEKPKHKDTIIKIIPLLIFVLSAASITNLSHRAYSHHEDWSSYLVGAGLAALVPVAVFVAIKIDGRKYKIGVWVIASIFAVISAAIQYQVYIPAAPRTDQVFEALAFGAGVPLAECLLAAMEAFLLGQVQQHAKADEQAALDRERAALEAETKRQQEAARLEFERRKQEIDLENYSKQLAQEAELKRLEAETKLELKRLEAEAKLQQRNVAKSVAENGDHDVARNENTPEKQNPATQRRNRLFDLLQQHGDIGDTAFANKLGVERTTIYRDFKAMEKAGLVHANGSGWTPGPKN